MKKLCLTAVIAVFCMIISNGVQAQTTQTNLDQLKLMQVFVGTWQHVISKDSIEIAEFKQYGNAFVENVYLVVNGKKSIEVMWNFGFSPKEGKFKIFQLRPSGNYSTWNGSFTTEKKFIGDRVQNFNPEKVLGKFEIEVETPTNFTVNFFNSDGVKTLVQKVTKVK